MNTDADQGSNYHDGSLIPPAQDERDPPQNNTDTMSVLVEPDTHRATGTDGQIVQFPASRNEPEKSKNAASRNSRVSRSKLMTNPDGLHITESRRNGQQSWTVKARRRGKKSDYFRVRIADAGYRVGLVYRDESGSRREPYCCYLSAKEWQSAKKGTIQTFARTIAGKIEQRRANGEADTGKLDVLLKRVRSLSGCNPEHG